MTENVTKTFIKFLKVNNVFNAFSKNIINGEKFRGAFGEDIEPSDYIDKKLKTEPIMIFMDGFAWSETQEGFDFWDNVNLLWMDLIKK